MELLAYLRRQRKLLVLLAGIAAVFAAVFSLYDLPVEAVGYAALLCLVLGAILFACDGCWSGRRNRSCPSPLPTVCWRRTTSPC